MNSSRCASCLHPRYVSHKFTTKSRTYVGTETHTTSTAVTVGYTGRSDWGSIQLGSSYSVSKTFKKYEVKYDSTATYDYYNAMGKFIRRETFNAVNLTRYEYIGV
ncbi:MAG: hypothetical protein ACRC5Q_02865 [Culicoidibacterales bacterium]